MKKENTKSKEDLEHLVHELKELKAKLSRDEKKLKKNEKKELMNNSRVVDKQDEIACELCDSKLFVFAEPEDTHESTSNEAEPNSDR